MLKSNSIQVVRGLPPTYKRQNVKFTVEQLRSVPIRLFSWEQYQLLDEVINNPKVLYSSLAETYGIPVGTVKSRINRARALLNKHLQEKRNEVP